MALIFGVVVILTTSLVAHSQDKSGPLPPHLPITLISQTPPENDTITNSTNATDTYSSPEVISTLQTTADSTSKSHPSPNSTTDSAPLITSTTAVPTDSTVTSTTSALLTSPTTAAATTTTTTKTTTTTTTKTTTTTTSTTGSPSAETSKQTTSLTAATTSSELFTESLTTTSPTFPPNMSIPTVEPATPTSTSQPSSTSVPPKQHHPGVSVALSLFILLAVILIIGAGVWWIRRRRQLERLRHQLMPMYNFDPTDDGDDWENQLLEEERSLRPEAEKVQLYSGNSTFDSGQKHNNSTQKE